MTRLDYSAIIGIGDGIELRSAEVESRSGCSSDVGVNFRVMKLEMFE